MFVSEECYIGIGAGRGKMIAGVKGVRMSENFPCIAVSILVIIIIVLVIIIALGCLCWKEKVF